MAGYVAFHSLGKEPKRLADNIDTILKSFRKEIKSHKTDRRKSQKELRSLLKDVQKAEMEARKKAGYKFD